MNAKIYNGNIQPNPKEFKIWVDDEGTIRTWNGTEWIETASSGGGGGGEASTIEYLDMRGMDIDKRIVICECSCFIKGNFNGSLGIVPAVFVVTEGDLMDVSFVAIDLNAVLVMRGQIGIINDYIKGMGVDTDAIPRITKEEFNDTNALPDVSPT